MYVYMANIRQYKSLAVDILTYMINYTYIYCYAGLMMQALFVSGLHQDLFGGKAVNKKIIT